MFKTFKKKLSGKFCSISLLPLALYAQNSFSYFVGANVELKNNTDFPILLNIEGPYVRCEDPNYNNYGFRITSCIGDVIEIPPNSNGKLCVSNVDDTYFLYQTSKAYFNLKPYELNGVTGEKIPLEQIASGEIELYTGATMWNMAAYFTNVTINKTDFYNISLQTIPKWENAKWVTAGSMVNLTIEVNGNEIKSN